MIFSPLYVHHHPLPDDVRCICKEGDISKCFLPHHRVPYSHPAHYFRILSEKEKKTKFGSLSHLAMHNAHTHTHMKTLVGKIRNKKEAKSLPDMRTHTHCPLTDVHITSTHTHTRTHTFWCDKIIMRAFQLLEPHFLTLLQIAK